MIDPRWGDALWAQSPDRGGANVISQGVHTFDLLSYFHDSEPVAIAAGGGAFTHPDSALIDSTVCTIYYANGSTASAVIGDFGPAHHVKKSFYQLFDGQGKSATIYGYFAGLTLGDGKETREVNDGRAACTGGARRLHRLPRADAGVCVQRRRGAADQDGRDGAGWPAGYGARYRRLHVHPRAPDRGPGRPRLELRRGCPHPGPPLHRGAIERWCRFRLRGNDDFCTGLYRRGNWPLACARATGRGARHHLDIL